MQAQAKRHDSLKPLGGRFFEGLFPPAGADACVDNREVLGRAELPADFVQPRVDVGIRRGLVESLGMDFPAANGIVNARSLVNHGLIPRRGCGFGMTV